MNSPDFLNNICKILGHDLKDERINDPEKMTYTFEKTCNRCGRYGKAVVKYVDLYTKKFDVLTMAMERVLWDFNSSPHKKL